MMPREYYYAEYEKNKKEIYAIIICSILGVVVAVLLASFYYSMSYSNNILDYAPSLLAIPFPYGLYKTWRTCLILTYGSSSMWILWIIYFSLKIVIAVFYGLIFMPVMLIQQSIEAIRNKNNIELALPISQMQQYNYQYQQNPINQQMYYNSQQMGYNQYSNYI